MEDMKLVPRKQSNHAVGYVRVSTDQQECSIEMQTERITDYCRLHGLVLDVIVVDENISGKTCIADRPEGNRIAGHLAAGASHVVALKLDRLFRNAANALMQCDDWQSTGVALHLIDMGGQSVNTGTPMGKMMLTMLAGFAEWERGMIAERTREALGHMKRKGYARKQNVPYGFDHSEGGRLVANPDEQSVLERMKGMRGQGLSLQGIADQLNANNVVSKTGSIWYAKTVQSAVAA